MTIKRPDTMHQRLMSIAVRNGERSMFYLNIKRYIKSPLFVCVTILYFVLLFVMIPVPKSSTLLSEVTNGTLMTQPFSFLFFMLVSYEFFYQIKKHHLQ